MFKQMKKSVKNEKGLTLIELLAVIVILGIIAAIAVPAIGNIISDSRDKAIVSEALNVIAGAKLAHVNGDCGDASNTPNVCEAGELAGYVEGVTLTGIEVEKNAGVWSISGVDASNLGAPSAGGGFVVNGTEAALAAQID
nr:prepilin-type N-terminal cleavage/methylation domain-containing protein [Lysinibacillus sp. BW-2-10]